MSNYRAVYERLANRAVQQGFSNLEAFVGRLVDQGVPSDRIEELLLEDLANDGPIFEAFFRSLGGAADSAIAAAHQQGSTMGAIDANAEIKRLLDLGSLEDVIDDADPDLMAEIEAASADRLDLTWVATMRNTCHLCLPLHGVTRTRQEWNDLGLDPATIHPGSWSSVCHCSLVEREHFDRDDQMAPLLRIKEKGSRRTVRGVTSANIETAIKARDKALESAEGRRLLRKLGQVNDGNETEES